MTAGRHAVLVGLAVLAVAASARAADYAPVHETAVGETEAQAVHEAYYAAFKRALLRVAGDQAAGEVGARFRERFDANFDAFRARFFSPDTDRRCGRQDGGTYLCEIEGTLELAALRTDVRELMQGADDRSRRRTFIFKDDMKDERKEVLVGKLAEAFERVGHRLLVDRDVRNAALARNQADFTLGIDAVTFSNLDDPAAYDPYDLRLRGTLTVRFRVTDLHSGRQLANLPVTASASEAGPYPGALKQPLVDDLSRQAAEEIGRAANAAVTSFEAERDAEGRAR